MGRSPFGFSFLDGTGGESSPANAMFVDNPSMSWKHITALSKLPLKAIDHVMEHCLSFFELAVSGLSTNAFALVWLLIDRAHMTVFVLRTSEQQYDTG